MHRITFFEFVVHYFYILLLPRKINLFCFLVKWCSCEITLNTSYFPDCKWVSYAIGHILCNSILLYSGTYRCVDQIQCLLGFRILNFLPKSGRKQSYRPRKWNTVILSLLGIELQNPDREEYERLHFW